MVVSINSERNCSWVRGLQERGRRKEGEGERGGLGRGNVWLEESKEGGNDDREGWLEKGWGSWRKVREGLEGKDSKINKEKESERVSGGSGSRKEKGRGDMDG